LKYQLIKLTVRVFTVFRPARFEVRSGIEEIPGDPPRSKTICGLPGSTPLEGDVRQDLVNRSSI
jgi:hypothetical protein